MRLIDADAVQKEAMKSSGKRILIVDVAPTVCDIEQIRAEIRELPTDARNMVRRTRVLDIIDRHIGRTKDEI